jgi:hypothetical protein
MRMGSAFAGASPVLGEGVEGERIDGDTAALAGLGGCFDAAAGDDDHCSDDVELSGVGVEIAPSQSAQLAAASAGGRRDGEKRPKDPGPSRSLP